MYLGQVFAHSIPTAIVAFVPLSGPYIADILTPVVKVLHRQLQFLAVFRTNICTHFPLICPCNIPLRTCPQVRTLCPVGKRSPTPYGSHTCVLTIY